MANDKYRISTRPNDLSPIRIVRPITNPQTFVVVAAAAVAMIPSKASAKTTVPVAAAVAGTMLKYLLAS
jgi:hypothetical protein